MSVQPTHQPPPRGDHARTAVETAADYLNLPAPTLTTRRDAVHVTVHGPGDLARWMYALGGEVHSHAAGDGAVLLTLCTATPARQDGTRVAVRVHTAVVEGDEVLVDVRTAAGAAAAPVAAGPFRMYVEPTASGAAIDVTGFARTVVQDVVELLLGDEFGARFDELVDAAPSDPHAVLRPGDLRIEQLVADLTARAGTRLALYGDQVRRLGERLLRVHEARRGPVAGERPAGGGEAA